MHPQIEHLIPAFLKVTSAVVKGIPLEALASPMEHSNAGQNAFAAAVNETLAISSQDENESLINNAEQACVQIAKAAKEEQNQIEAAISLCEANLKKELRMLSVYKRTITVFAITESYAARSGNYVPLALMCGYFKDKDMHEIALDELVSMDAEAISQILTLLTETPQKPEDLEILAALRAIQNKQPATVSGQFDANEVAHKFVDDFRTKMIDGLIADFNMVTGAAGSNLFKKLQFSEQLRIANAIDNNPATPENIAKVVSHVDDSSENSFASFIHHMLKIDKAAAKIAKVLNKAVVKKVKPKTTKVVVNKPKKALVKHGYENLT